MKSLLSSRRSEIFYLCGTHSYERSTITLALIFGVSCQAVEVVHLVHPIPQCLLDSFLYFRPVLVHPLLARSLQCTIVIFTHSGLTFRCSLDMNHSLLPRTRGTTHRRNLSQGGIALGESGGRALFMTIVSIKLYARSCADTY